MPSAEYDLRYLQTGLGLLEDYLLSPDLYWALGANPPAAEPPYPRLTLGGLMLARLRVQAHDLTPEQKSMLTRLAEQMDAVHSRWRVAWGQKAAAEFHSRLTLWSNFLGDYRENPAANDDRYAYEVTRRVLLHLLAQDAENIPQAEVDLLASLDNFLRSVLLPGDFVWDKELASVFPRDPYWYLYGRLKGG